MRFPFLCRFAGGGKRACFPGFFAINGAPARVTHGGEFRDLDFDAGRFGIGRGRKCDFLGDFEFFQNTYSRFLGVFGVFVDGGKGEVPFHRGFCGFSGRVFPVGV